MLDITQQVNTTSGAAFSYQFDVQSGELAACADMQVAQRVCKQRNQQVGASEYEVEWSQCSSARGGDGWPLDL